MNKNITVIGIGKLGLSFSLILEKEGYSVVGMDIDETYIQKINNKTLFSPEPKVQEHLISSENFVATTEIKTGLEHSDVLFLFVATPSLNNGRYDHSQIDRVVSQLITNNNTTKEKHLIIGCTTMPGFCQEAQKKLQDHGFIVSYNPEFIAQGSVMNDLVNPDIILIGEGNQSAGDEIENIYSTFLQNRPSIHRMTPKEAEITKIALNCFLTTKIAYANMVGDIAKSAGCNPDIILNAVGSDSRIGNKYLKYGYGFGGPCFPRDNRAFGLFAGDLGLDAPISHASDKSNRQHLDNQIKIFTNIHSRNEPVHLINVAYKPGTTIIDESQQLAFAVRIAREGYHVTIEDNEDVITQVENLHGELFDYVIIKNRKADQTV